MSKLALAAKVAGIGQNLTDLFGHVEDEVTVRIVGTPYSNKRQLFRLAASIAFGLVKRHGPAAGLVPPPGMIMVNYSAVSKELEFTVRYRNSLAVVLATELGTAFRGKTPLQVANEFPVLTGPDDVVVGDAWTFTGPGLGVKAPVIGAVSVQNLEWQGRTLLTDQPTVADPDPALPAASAPIIPTPNPRPCGDLRSRGTLVGLVFSALTQPGAQHLLAYPGVDPTRKFSGG